MKKSLIFWFAMLTILLLASCKTTQPTLQNTTTIATNKVITKDSTKVIDRSLAITDSLTVIIGNLRTGNKLCDSLCKIEVDRLLSQINTSKQSGNNSTKIFYDPKTNSIKAVATIGETKNESVAINKTHEKYKNEFQLKQIAVAIPLSREQKFNLWTGRLFWLMLICYTSFRVYKWTSTIV